MKITFMKLGKRTQVRIDDIAGHEQSIAATIRECRNNSRACPSGECRTIESIEECEEGGSVLLTIKPYRNAQLTQSTLEECLRYML